MTPVEIAYFKHFMFDKQIAAPFQYYYRKHRPGRNPESIEEYLLSVSKEDVIMKAFNFVIESQARSADATYDYWDTINQQWQSYIQSMADNFSNDSWPQLRYTFAILRQNWDLPNYWRKENFESTSEVYERMRIRLPLPEFQWGHGISSLKRVDEEQIKTNVFNAKDGDVLVRLHKCDDGHISRMIVLFRELVPYETDGLQLHKANLYASLNCKRWKLKTGDETRSILVTPSKDVVFRLAFPEEKKILMDELDKNGLMWDETEKVLVKKEEPSPLTVKEAPSPVVAEEDPLAGIDFFSHTERTYARLERGDASLNLRKSFKLTINQYDSSEIENAQMAFVRHGMRDGSFLLVFNTKEGQKVNFYHKTKNNCQAVINSKEINSKLHTCLNIKSDYAILHVEKVAATNDYIIYKITK